jgi:hypothetical protein
MFDQSKTYCRWNLSKTSLSGQCDYSLSNQFSLTAIVCIILIVLIIASIVNTPIDLIFNALEAENEKLTYDKVQKQNGVSDEASNLFDVLTNDNQSTEKKEV